MNNYLFRIPATLPLPSPPLYYVLVLPLVFLSLLATPGNSKTTANIEPCRRLLSQLPLTSSSSASCKCSTTVWKKLRLECVPGTKTDPANLLAAMAAATNNGTTPDSLFEKITLKGCSTAIKRLGPVPRLHVRSLEISNCTIGTVDAHSFDALASTLEELILRNASLTSVPQVQALSELRSLNLNGNMVKDVPEHAFDGLKKLKQLRLMNNRIATLSPNALAEVKSTLELLDLSANQLRAVPAQTLRNSLALSYLSLSGNNIQEIAQMQFMNLPKLVELHLDNNHLSHVSPVGLMNVPQLRHLHLRGNALTVLDMGNLQTFKQLEVIDLGENKFSKAPSFKELSRLVEVQLDHNLLKRIDTLTFSANPRLRTVNMCNNHIAAISRNSFDSLDSLTTLVLSDNELPRLERSMFDGMRNLKRLHLRNNLLEEVANNTFVSVPNIAVVDLSGNKLTGIGVGTFAYLKRLHLLDISNNQITGFEEGAFQSRIAQILLEENRLDCGHGFDWFIDYLVRNKVRTFLPNQAEISCASPEEFAGLRLRDMMMKRANETLTTASHYPSPGGGGGPIAGGAAGELMETLTNGGVTDLSHIMGATSGNNGVPPASGISSQLPANLNQLLSHLPSMVVNIPGLGAVDISKLPPGLLEHVLKGGQVPGVSREALDSVLRQYTERLKQLAAPGNQPPRIAIPMGEGGLGRTALPQWEYERVSPATPRAMGEGDYADARGNAQDHHILIPDSHHPPPNLTELFSPKVLALMRLLPPGFNYSLLSPEVMKSVMAGEMPDLSLLPPELLEHFKRNIDHIFSSLNRMPDVSIEEILRKLPRFEQPNLSTFSPYDINRVEADVMLKGDKDASRTRLYMVTALSLVGLVSMSVLFVVFFKLRSQRRRAASPASVHDIPTKA